MTQRIDVAKNGKPWLTNQPNTDALWKRIRTNAHAGATIETRPHVPAPTPKPPDPVRPKPPDPLELARNVCFFASVPDDYITYFNRLPKNWKAAFTCDPSYPVTDQQINSVKASGHRAFAWGDCHSPGLMPADIKAFQASRKLDGWYGEAESALAFDVAHEFNAPAVVGKLSALVVTQLAVVAAGGPPLFINETYYNVQPDLVPDWRNANKGVGGNCWAFYASDAEHAAHTPLDSRFNAATDSVYTEGMTDQDWLDLIKAALL